MIIIEALILTIFGLNIIKFEKLKRLEKVLPILISYPDTNGTK